MSAPFIESLGGTIPPEIEFGNASMRLLFLGDTILKTRDGGNPFAHVASLFSGFDFIVMNLETCIVSERKQIELQSKSTQFFVYEEGLDWLFGYRQRLIFTMANNHVMDCMDEGLRRTCHFLDHHGFRYVPLDSPLFIGKRALRVRLDAVYRGIQSEYFKELIAAKKELSNECINILCIHWGLENIVMPSVEQIDSAWRQFRRGVHVVVGHHSHTPQGMLVTDGNLCAFSLGNFNMLHCTDMPRKAERIGLALALEIDGEKHMAYQRIPLHIGSSYAAQVDSSLSVKQLILQLDALIPQKRSFSRLRHRISYESHVSRYYLWDNLRFGWLPRIRKYGIPHFLQMLRWFCSRRFVCSLFFLPFHAFSRGERVLRRLNWKDA